MTKKTVVKPEYDKLSVPVQTLLKKHEFKILDAIRRESNFPTLAAYVRALILDKIKGEKQTKLF